MKIIGVVQARMGSTRLPNKVMKPLNGVPMIELLLNRLSKSKELELIVVATSINPLDDDLADYVQTLGFPCERGNESDVLSRFVQVGQRYQADALVRITGDCPLVDPEMVDECVNRFREERVDYFSNIEPPTYPDGLDVEVMTMTALQQALGQTKDRMDREHVTTFLRDSGLFKTGSMINNTDLSNLRWTVDEIDDFEVITEIFRALAPRILFSWHEVLELHGARPELFSNSQDRVRNYGAMIGTGQKLWERAKRIIPGGNMLVSKRPEMFLPDQWPTYFSKAKGCRVWDLDEREYIDMSIMGVGTNILGYGHSEIDEAVAKIVSLGNLSTLNCPEEVFLAEKLIELHPWAGMARLARTGGEANAMAIRIARAASRKHKVAFCGYHGWHDWYLAANLSGGSVLDTHLLTGLDPQGVPPELSGTVLPFHYGKIDELEEVTEKHDIGVIKMEVARNTAPDVDFLRQVRQIATERNIILVFDECTTGFRQNFGGLHLSLDVEPDMAILGKALGNGYAITAVIGREEIMQSAQSSFISSTFWTERIGPTAALKTMEVMHRLKSWDSIIQSGLMIREGWQKLADRYGLTIKHLGLPALTGFYFSGENTLEYKTLLAQEMLKKGFLSSTNVYVCIEHTSDIVSDYFEALDSVFALVRDCEDGRDVFTLLNGPTCHSTFKRLN